MKATKCPKCQVIVPLPDNDWLFTLEDDEPEITCTACDTDFDPLGNVFWIPDREQAVVVDQEQQTQQKQLF